MQVIDVIRAAIPGASEELCEFIIWERTAYPMAGIGAKDLYQAATRFQRAKTNKVRLCDHCDNKVDQERSKYMCARCFDIVAKHSH